MKEPYYCSYRPTPDAPEQKFVLYAEAPGDVLDRIQRRFHPERTEQEWQQLEAATDRRLLEIRRAREAREARERELERK